MLWCVTSIDLILCCVFFSLLQSDKRASQKPFYLHPPESSGNKTVAGNKKKNTTSNNNHLQPALLSSNKGLSSNTQPNLDERLRQYSAYELNRRSSGHHKKKSSQLSSSHHSISENQSDSSGSFFLHDPSTVGYNRLSDLFPGSAAQTVCSDDSGVGLTSPNTVKPLTRPKQKPPLPPIGNSLLLKSTQLS